MLSKPHPSMIHWNGWRDVFDSIGISSGVPVNLSSLDGRKPNDCMYCFDAEAVDTMAMDGQLLPRQERSSQTGNHGTTPPYGRELPPGRTRKGEVDSDSLFRVFRWIPWLISDPSRAAIGCCWTESAVRICADLGCRGNSFGVFASVFRSAFPAFCLRNRRLASGVRNTQSKGSQDTVTHAAKFIGQPDS